MSNHSIDLSMAIAGRSDELGGRRPSQPGLTTAAPAKNRSEPRPNPAGQDIGPGVKLTP